MAQISSVLRQLPDGISVLVHELLLDKRAYLGVVELRPVPRGLAVDSMGVRRQLLLDVERLGQALELVQLEVAGAAHHLGVDDVEVHLLAALAEVLDEVEGVVPRAVRQFAEDLLEAGPVLLVVGVVGGQKEEVERAGYVGVCVFLDFAGDAFYGAVLGVAVGKVVDSCGEKQKLLAKFSQNINSVFKLNDRWRPMPYRVLWE